MAVHNMFHLPILSFVEKVATQLLHDAVFAPDSGLSEKIPRSLSRLMGVVEIGGGPI